MTAGLPPQTTDFRVSLCAAPPCPPRPPQDTEIRISSSSHTDLFKNAAKLALLTSLEPRKQQSWGKLLNFKKRKENNQGKKKSLRQHRSQLWALHPRL